MSNMPDWEPLRRAERLYHFERDPIGNVYDCDWCGTERSSPFMASVSYAGGSQTTRTWLCEECMLRPEIVVHMLREMQG